MPYVPGKPIEELQREMGLPRAVKLASNENPIGPSPKAMAVLAETVPTCTGIQTAERFACVGPCRALESGTRPGHFSKRLRRNSRPPSHEPSCRRGDEAVMAEHTFVIYKMEVQAAHGVAVEVPQKNWHHDLPAMAAAITEKTRLLFVCNPNNPTGNYGVGQIRPSWRWSPDHVVVSSTRPITNMSGIPEFPESTGYVENVICQEL